MPCLEEKEEGKDIVNGCILPIKTLLPVVGDISVTNNGWRAKAPCPVGFRFRSAQVHTLLVG